MRIRVSQEPLMRFTTKVILLVIGWFVAGVSVIVAWILHSGSGNPNWANFVDRDFYRDGENEPQYQGEQAGNAEMAGETGMPVSKPEGETVWRPYKEVGTVRETPRKRFVDIRSSARAAFSAIYQRLANRRTEPSLSEKAQTVEALLNPHYAQSPAIQERLEAGEVSSEQLSKLRALADELRQTDRTVTKYGDNKIWEDALKVLGKHEELLRSDKRTEVKTTENATKAIKSKDTVEDAASTAGLEGRAKAAGAGQ